MNQSTPTRSSPSRCPRHTPPTRPLQALLLLAAAALPACRSDPDLPAAPPATAGSASDALAADIAPTLHSIPTASRPHAPQVHVVIYLIDTLRPDALGAYGNPRGLTPNIDALARDAVVFQHAYAPAPWTLPSVVSLLTSQFVTEHGVVDIGNWLSPSTPTLGTRLTATGYACAALTANAFAKRAAGPEVGYPLCIDIPKFADIRSLARALDAAGPRPTHLYIHTTEPHNPYRAPPDWVARFAPATPADITRANDRMAAYRRLTRADMDAGLPTGTLDNTREQDAAMAQLAEIAPTLRAIYDANVAWADLHLQAVIDLLRQRGHWDDCHFVLLSDHGEEFNEHGGWQHDQSLYEEVIRVPLIMRFPRGRFGGKRFADPVRLVDVMPTILDLVGLDADAQACRGRSLLPLLDDAAPPPPDRPQVVSVRINERKHYRPYKQRRGDTNIAVRNGSLKGIWNVERATFELYDLARDPLEQADLASAQPDLVAPLWSFAREWLRNEVRGRAASRPVTPDDARNLRELGYIAGDDDAPGVAPSASPGHR